MISYRYKRDGNNIITPGVSWGYGIGSTLNLIHECGEYAVWHKPTSKDWVGLGMRPGVFEATYWLMDVSTDIAKVIKRVEPGRNWRKARQELIKECDKLWEERLGQRGDLEAGESQ